MKRTFILTAFILPCLVLAQNNKPFEARVGYVLKDEKIEKNCFHLSTIKPKNKEIDKMGSFICTHPELIKKINTGDRVAVRGKFSRWYFYTGDENKIVLSKIERINSPSEQPKALPVFLSGEISLFEK